MYFFGEAGSLELLLIAQTVDNGFRKFIMLVKLICSFISSQEIFLYTKTERYFPFEVVYHEIRLNLYY